MALGSGVKPPLPEKTELSSPVHSRPISSGYAGACDAVAVAVAGGVEMG